MKKFIYALTFFFVAFLATSNTAVASDVVNESIAPAVETEKTVLVEEAPASQEEDVIIIIETDCCIVIIVIR